MDPTLTGEEAYQRRLAMSSGLRPVAPTAPVLSSTLSFRPSSTVPEPAQTPAEIRMATIDEDEIPYFPETSQPPGVVPPTTETGEEAFLRRLAMSKSAQSAPVPPPIAQEPPALAYNPFAPPSLVPPPAAAGLPSTGSALSEEKVKSSREAAAAIAAKLAALKPPEPASSETGAGSSVQADSSSK